LPLVVGAVGVGGASAEGGRRLDSSAVESCPEPFEGCSSGSQFELAGVALASRELSLRQELASRAGRLVGHLSVAEPVSGLLRSTSVQRGRRV